MKNILLCLFLLVIKTCLCQELDYNITTTWNGTDFTNEHDVIMIHLETINDLLFLEVKAPFFENPVPPEELLDGCPQRPYDGLYNFEVSASKNVYIKKYLILLKFLNSKNFMIQMSICQVQTLDKRLSAQSVDNEKVIHWALINRAYLSCK